MVRFISILMLMMSLLSVFLWAAFDFSWWAPFDNKASAREFILIVLHSIGIVVPSALIMVGCIVDEE